MKFLPPVSFNDSKPVLMARLSCAFALLISSAVPALRAETCEAEYARRMSHARTEAAREANAELRQQILKSRDCSSPLQKKTPEFDFEKEWRNLEASKAAQNLPCAGCPSRKDMEQATDLMLEMVVARLAVEAPDPHQAALDFAAQMAGDTSLPVNVRAEQQAFWLRVAARFPKQALPPAASKPAKAVKPPVSAPRKWDPVK